MKHIPRILVSGASGIVGYGILRSLQRSKKRLLLFASTTQSHSAAEGFCDSFLKAIPTQSEDYIPWLCEVIHKNQIDLAIPGIEADLYKWNDHRRTLQDTGTRLMLNRPELIEISRDKRLFYEALCQHQLSMRIPTSFETHFDSIAQKFGLPFLLKPRCGYASRGIVRVHDSQTFDQHKEQIGPILMVQPLVGTDDEEYSVSAFGDGEGGFWAAQSLRRQLASQGYTEKAEAIESQEIQEAISELCRCFQPRGPTNFQFRKHEGALKLLEINPRISSATSIRSAFGYNEAAMAVDYFLKGRPPQQPPLRTGWAVRYAEDLVFFTPRS
ncbi:MAG: hypothetical protein RLZZ399_377 [Verrucomicrobiota bacterium]|jgi:carbamoyl-phosphate synthase large subunit